jgi:hypothetical protein
LVLNLPKTPKKKESLQPKIPAVNFFLDSWGEDSRGKFTAGIFKMVTCHKKWCFFEKIPERTEDSRTINWASGGVEKEGKGKRGQSFERN